MARQVLLAVVAALLAFGPGPARAASAGGSNGKIVLSSDRAGPPGHFQIYTMNPDGSGVTRLTDDPGNDRNPAWSPDGQKIAFASNQPTPSGAYWLYVMNADGSAQTKVNSSHTIDPENISWSPNGQEVVVASEGYAAIEAVDGSSYTRVIWVGHDPAWSPDGQKIAFRWGDGQFYATGKLYTVNPDGSEQTYIYSSPIPGGTWGPNTTDPAWRPDDVTLAFTFLTPGTALHDIYSTSDRSGDTLRRLTNETAEPEGTNNRGADWSPDGEKIVYERDGDIYSMDADGANPTPLTTGPEQDREPNWQPVQPGPTDPGYPRPKGATPFQTYLVLAYRPCLSPDEAHGPPLAGPSCSTPTQASDYLTVGTLDANGQPAKFIGSVRMDVRPGDAATPQNDADVALHAKLTDVRCLATSDPCPDGALSDYQGSLDGTFDARITDRFNTGAQPTPATVRDLATATTPLHAAIPCSATADTTVGSTCEVTTSLNAILPSVIREGKRAIWALGPVQVKDGGDDGNGATGDDDTPFATEGVFVP